MSAKLIAKLQEPNIAGRFLICRSDEKGVYLTKNEYLDTGGKVEATSVGWSRIGTPDLRHLLSLHFGLTDDAITEILAK